MHRRYLLGALLVLICCVGGIVGLNAGIDPYSDFYYLTGRPARPPPSNNQYAERKYKSRLLRDTPAGGFRRAVFGNSRATALDPGAGGVNLAFAGASLTEIAVFVDEAMDRQPDLIPVIAADFDQCFGDGANLLYLNGETWLRSAADAAARLLSIDTAVMGLRILVNRRALSEVEMLPRGNNIRALDYGDHAKIAPRIADDLRAYAGFLAPSRFRPGCAGQFGEIRRKYPRTLILVNPPTRAMLDLQDRQGLAGLRRRWLTELSAAGPVLDFSCARSLTDHPAGFADGHHYGPAVADAMMADIGRVLNGRAPTTGRLLRPPVAGGS